MSTDSAEKAAQQTQTAYNPLDFEPTEESQRAASLRGKQSGDLSTPKSHQQRKESGHLQKEEFESPEGKGEVSKPEARGTQEADKPETMPEVVGEQQKEVRRVQLQKSLELGASEELKSSHQGAQTMQELNQGSLLKSDLSTKSNLAEERPQESSQKKDAEERQEDDDD